MPADTKDAVNQVLFQYNDFGQPVAEYQEHDGVVSTSTSLKVGYSYADGTGGHTRRTRVVYPNGRILRYEYDSDADDAANRPTLLADDEAGSIGTELAEYSYLGLGQIVRVDYPEPGLRYDLAHGTGADPSSSSGETETDVVRICHGYDRAGNRLWREDPVAASYGKDFDELYTYDGMNQVIDLQRGDLNANKTAVTSKAFAESWTLDPTGNWCTFRQDTDGDGAWELDQDRTHNEVNELTGISEEPGQTPWVDPVHDAVGNMTSLPKPGDPEESLTAKYDAWNRLVEVSDDGVLIAKFGYDGLGRRILKAIHQNASGSLDCFQHIFLADEQVVEIRETDTESDAPESNQPKYQHVWSPHYIDWLIVRDENTNSDAACDDARIYYLGDANYNVTALADNAGNVLERYVYSAYGDVTVLDSDGSPDTDDVSDHDNTTLYTGRELDPSTGLYYYRARYYHAGLGRFLARDPLRFRARDANPYWYVGNRVLSMLDPSGLQTLLRRPPGQPGAGFPGMPDRPGTPAALTPPVPPLRPTEHTLVLPPPNHIGMQVCCRSMHGNWLEGHLVTHCQLRNVCAPNETVSYDVWRDRSPRRCMDNGIRCSKATKQDIERCLRRNPHSDNPFGGEPGVGNNCQAGTMRRLGKCCLQSNWRPHWYAGHRQGRCLEWELYTYMSGGLAVNGWRCLKRDWPDWYGVRPPVTDFDPPVLPSIDDTSHGGWPSEADLPGIEYPEYPEDELD